MSLAQTVLKENVIMHCRQLAVLLFIPVILIGTAAVDGAEGPVQPVFELFMKDVDVYQGEWDFYRSPKGELVLIHKGGLEGTAIASDDEGRTWRKWPEITTWPAVGITAIIRRGNDLFCHGPDAPDLRVYHSEDDGRTWNSGHPLMQWPKLVAIPNGPRQNHPNERFRGKALLWSTPGDRIVVNHEGHLVISIMWLLGGEGSGPELVGTLLSKDNGATWRCYELFGPPQGYRDRPSGFAEPKPVLLSDGRMWLVFRTCLGHLWQAFSEDGGRTWGEPLSTGLDAPLAPLHADRVPGQDSVVVVWNNSKPSKSNAFGPREPMVFAVSHDHCKTWSRPVPITEGRGYMRNIFFSDKEMFVLYEDGPSYRPKLVIYNLKEVLALRPRK